MVSSTQQKMMVPKCFMVFIVALLFISVIVNSKAHAYDYQNMPGEDKEFLIKDLKGDCLDVAWGSTSPGAAVNAFHTCHGGDNQIWTFINPYGGSQLARHGHRQIMNKNSGLCLTTTPHRSVQGAHHTQEPCLVYGIDYSLDRQLFQVRESDNWSDWHVIGGKYGRGCIYDNRQDGTNAVTWYKSYEPCPDNLHFFWEFVPVN